jgi:cytochrome c2
MKAAAVVLICTAILCGCEGGRSEPRYSAATGGNPQRGAQLITKFDCGSCHTIPGVRAANGVVAPPLDFFSRRSFIAGELPNTFDNLVLWLRNPVQVEPGTAMPVLGITEEQARDIAAYLYTLS